MVTSWQASQEADPPDLIDFDTDEPDSLSDSSDESHSESAFDAKTRSDHEANQVTLKEFVLSTALNDLDRHDRSLTRTQHQDADAIIDKAREYQQELFDRAKEENVIAVLDTGSGKTLIAALLIRHFLQQELVDRNEGKPPKIVFFLANSVHLARQQARFLESNLPQNVVSLFGDSKDDLWRRAEWDRIFADNSIVVCTPAVLDQCLFHRFLTIGQISLLVFDEAHHCKKNHPYSRIIRDHYLKWKEDRPRIFGMTASPVDSKRDIGHVVADLEALLQSKIITTNDLSVYDFAPRATDEIWAYPPLETPEFETQLYDQLHQRCGFIAGLETHFSFSRWASRHLGAWAADRVWKYALPTSEHEALSIIRDMERSAAYMGEVDDDKRQAALQAVHETVSIVKGHTFGRPLINADREVSSKVRYLYTQIKDRFSSSPATRAIVFVDRRYVAYLLADLFIAVDLPHIRPGVLVGIAGFIKASGSWKDQENVMERFRTGAINLIFATSVAEEGIDVPRCNLVVRFDLYSTPIQYMQSRGRARMKNSIFAHMIEDGDKSQLSQVDYVMEQDDYIRRFCQQLPPDRLLGHGSKLKQLMAKDASCQSFVTSSGAMANYSNALLILARYAKSLLKVGAHSAEVYEEVIMPDTNTFRYKVILPATDDERTAAVKGARGDARTNKVLARRAAAWHCCFKLRKAGLLNENLDSIFVKVKPLNSNQRSDITEKKDDYDKKIKPDFWRDSGAGSLELPTELFVTHVVVGPRSPSTTANGFLLLTRRPLPEIPPFSVFMGDNEEKQVVFNQIGQPVSVTADQLEALTTYTINGIFTDVFNKTFTIDANAMSYWLAPPANGTLQGSLEGLINMDELLLAGNSERQRWVPATDVEEVGEHVEEWCKAFLVDPRNGALHYFTESTVPGKTIWDAPLESSLKFKKKHHDTIFDFTDSTWRQKQSDTGVPAWKHDPLQPVLKAKLVAGGRNFLKPCPEEKKRFAMCYVAPGPLEIARVSYAMAEICQLLPVIVHRVEAYMIVGEAFEKLGLSEVPAHLALEAFTQDTSAEVLEGEEVSVVEGSSGGGNEKADMNYERLEFIGDSLLKMMTTITVFNRTTCDEEGMHCKRMDLISNSRLCSVACAPHYELYRHVCAGGGELWRDTWYPEFLKQTKGRVIKLGNKHLKHALGRKTIADVSEATIGACVMARQHHPVEERFDLGITAITKLVESPDHAITSWKEIVPMYHAPEWSTALNDPVANDLARRVQKITGYRFRHPRLVRSAFTHSSDQSSLVPDLQRLEFLGDACLDWVCIWWLFTSNPTRGPQWLTEHKMAMVSNRFLASLGALLGFHKLIHASSPALYEEIAKYAARVQEGYGQDGVTPDAWTGISSGASPPKALADLVESYLGAVLIDSGFDFGEIEKFFERHVKRFFEDIEAYDSFANRHPTTHLMRLLQETFKCRHHSTEILDELSTPTTRPIGGGDDNGQDDGAGEGGVEVEGEGDQAVGGVTMYVGWFVHQRMVAGSSGRSVKYARVRASKAALKNLGDLSVEDFRRDWGCDCA